MADWFYPTPAKPPLIVVNNDGPHPCPACQTEVSDGPKNKYCPGCRERRKAAVIARAQRKVRERRMAR